MLNLRKGRLINYPVVFLLVLTIAFFLRFFVVFYSELPWYSVDSNSYLHMADAILAGKPYSRFPNGFPIMIAIVKSIFNPDWVPQVLVLINVLLSTAVVGLSMEISKKLIDNIITVCVTGLIIAFYPNQLNYVRQILTEVPTTFFLVLSVYLFLNYKYYTSGLILFIAVLFRSSLVPLIPLMIICIYFHTDQKNLKIVYLKYLLGLASSATFYLSLLIIGVVKPANNLTQNILVSINSRNQNNDFSPKVFTSKNLEHPIRTYLTFAWDNPGEYLKQRLISLQELWGWPSSGNPPRTLLDKLLIAVRIPLILTAIMGFYQRIKEVDVWVLFLPILVITTVHIFSFSTTRFSYVVEPFAIILAIIAFYEFMMHFSNQNRFEKNRVISNNSATLN